LEHFVETYIDRFNADMEVIADSTALIYFGIIAWMDAE